MLKTFPNTYGEVMLPLDVDQLPEPFLSQYRANPRVREWIYIADRVHRAEKVSSWTQWTAEESAAYENKDYLLFSRLRGYTEAEIQEFERYMVLTHELEKEMGDEYYCLDACFVMEQIVSTPAYVEVNETLLRMSQAASTGQEHALATRQGS